MFSKILFIMIILFSFESFSATRAQKRMYRYLKSPFSVLQLGLSGWQETIEIVSDSENASLETSFTGLSFGYLRYQPLKRLKWMRSFGATLDFGTAKAQAVEPAVDRLKEQPWLRASLIYGYQHRTGFRTSLGLFLPVSYKLLLWDIEDTLTVNDEAFSVGLSGKYTYKLNIRTTISFALEHQFMWDASIWTVKFGREFR